MSQKCAYWIYCSVDRTKTNKHLVHKKYYLYVVFHKGPKNFFGIKTVYVKSNLKFLVKKYKNFDTTFLENIQKNKMKNQGTL